MTVYKGVTNALNFMDLIKEKTLLESSFWEEVKIDNQNFIKNKKYDYVFNFFYNENNTKFLNSFLFKFYDNVYKKNSKSSVINSNESTFPLLPVNQSIETPYQSINKNSECINYIINVKEKTIIIAYYITNVKIGNGIKNSFSNFIYIGQPKKYLNNKFEETNIFGINSAYYYNSFLRNEVIRNSVLNLNESVNLNNTNKITYESVNGNSYPKTKNLLFSKIFFETGSITNFYDNFDFWLIYNNVTNKSFVDTNFTSSKLTNNKFLVTPIYLYEYKFKVNGYYYNRKSAFSELFIKEIKSTNNFKNGDIILVGNEEYVVLKNEVPDYFSSDFDSSFNRNRNTNDNVAFLIPNF